MKTMFSLFLYSIQIILPFMAILIAYCCFRALFRSLKPMHPLIVLLNRATGEKIPIMYWENSVGRDKHCDIVLNLPSVSETMRFFIGAKEDGLYLTQILKWVFR